MADETLGERIRRLREAKGMTLRALAREVGVSAPFLSDLEHGRRQTEKLPAFAEALGCDLYDLECLSLRRTSTQEYLKVVGELKELKAEMREKDEMDKRAVFDLVALLFKVVGRKPAADESSRSMADLIEERFIRLERRLEAARKATRPMCAGGVAPSGYDELCAALFDGED